MVLIIVPFILRFIINYFMLTIYMSYNIRTYSNGPNNLRNSSNYIDQKRASTIFTGIAANKAKGLNTGGWNLYSTYTDGTGATRHKAETLVAMGVTAATAGDAGTTGVTADEDAVVADS